MQGGSIKTLPAHLIHEKASTWKHDGSSPRNEHRWLREQRQALGVSELSSEQPLLLALLAWHAAPQG